MFTEYTASVHCYLIANKFSNISDEQQVNVYDISDP